MQPPPVLRALPRDVTAFTSRALGGLLAGQQDWARAEAAYRAAIVTGDQHWAPIAQVDLAAVRQRQGDAAGARELLEQAAASENPRAVAMAQARLGDLPGNR